MKKVLAALLLLCCIGQTSPALAHTLAIDGSIGVTTHLDPDDEPITGQPVTIFIDIQDRTNQFDFKNCQCSVVIKEKESILKELPFVGDEGYQSISFIFPKAGSYNLIVKGQPKANSSFQTFTTSFSYYVRAGAGLITLKQSNPLQQYIPYVTLAAALVILMMFLWPHNRSKKGSQDGKISPE